MLAGSVLPLNNHMWSKRWLEARTMPSFWRIHSSRLRMFSGTGFASTVGCASLGAGSVGVTSSEAAASVAAAAAVQNKRSANNRAQAPVRMHGPGRHNTLGILSPSCLHKGRPC